MKPNGEAGTPRLVKSYYESRLSVTPPETWHTVWVWGRGTSTPVAYARRLDYAEAQATVDYARRLGYERVFALPYGQEVGR